MALTKEQKIEFLKCKDDPVYFISKYIYITTENEGIIKFNLWNYQKELIQDVIYNDGENLYHIRKSRQIGVSTLMSAIAVWMANFHSAKSIAIVATDLKTAQKLHAKALFAWENLPDWMRVDKIKRNTKELQLVNQSSIEAFPFKKNQGTRSISASLIILDEVAFMDGADKLYTAVKPSAEHGKIVALSSPNGPSGWFFDAYEKSKRGEMTFKLIKLDWRVHPNRDQKWRDQQDLEMGKREAKQEYDAEFGFSDDTFISPEFLEFIDENHVKDPIKKIMRGQFWVWEEPQPNEKYMIVVDPAGGESKKSDYSCVQVIRISTLTQVAEFLDKIHYDKFNLKVVQIARMYNNGLLIIEDNSIGKTTVSKAKELGYVNIYRRGSNRKEQEILGITKSHFGWNTNTRTRPLIMQSLRGFLETYEGFMKIQSERTLDQLRTFSDTTTRAKGSKHDDAILPISIGCLVYQLNNFDVGDQLEKYDMIEMMAHGNNMAKKNYEKMVEEESKLEEMSDQEKDEYYLKKKKENILKNNRLYKSQFRSRNGKSHHNDFYWVFGNNE